MHIAQWTSLYSHSVPLDVDPYLTYIGLFHLIYICLYQSFYLHLFYCKNVVYSINKKDNDIHTVYSQLVIQKPKRAYIRMGKYALKIKLYNQHCISQKMPGIQNNIINAIQGYNVGMQCRRGLRKLMITACYKEYRMNRGVEEKIRVEETHTMEPKPFKHSWASSVFKIHFKMYIYMYTAHMYM